jgi:hypothetical protein
VVLDARDGSLVAMASNPSFNPNDFIANTADHYFKDPNKPQINRALNPYAPGSTFKLFSAMATLKYGIRTAGETYLDTGCFEFGNDQRLCNARKARYGTVDLPRAHRFERHLLLQRRQRVLERLPRRGRRQRPVHRGLRHPGRGAGVRVRIAHRHQPER